MIYYKKIDNRIEKYLISSDSNALTELRNLVILSCSEKTHIIQNNSCIIPKLSFDEFEIKNLKTKLVHDSKFEFEKRYDIEYDCFQYPYLIHIIDSILAGDSSVIEELFNPTIDKKSVQERMYDLCSNMVKNIDDKTISKQKLDEQLKELDHLRKLDPNQLSPLPFYKNVIDCLSIELVDILLLSEIERFKMFFEDDIELLNSEIKGLQKIK